MNIEPLSSNSLSCSKLVFASQAIILLGGELAKFVSPVHNMYCRFEVGAVARSGSNSTFLFIHSCTVTSK